MIGDNERNGRKSYELYAITSSKKFAKRFKSERDMTKFYVCDSKMDREEYSKFANDNMNNILAEYKLDTIGIDNNGLITNDSVSVLMTAYEQDVACNGEPMYLFSDPAFWNSVPYPTSFLPEIKKALQILEYNSFHKLFRYSFNPYDNFANSNGNYLFPEDRPAERIDLDKAHDEDIDVDYDAPNIMADQLAIFVSNFKRTFKIDE